MFDVIRSNCCGIDVHKSFVFACIGITDSRGLTEYFTHRFSTFTRGLNQLVEWLTKYNCFQVCMESTGKYWIPVYNILEETEFYVELVHPKYTKPIQNHKTDPRDAKWICDLFASGLTQASFIPPKDIRELRDILRYRYKLITMRTSEKNRALNCLTVSNFKLDNVFSDVFGKSSRSIIYQILNNPGETFDVTPFVDKRCKTPIEDIQAAVDGAISPQQAVKLRQCLAHIDEIDGYIAEIDKAVYPLTEKYSAQLELLRTIPGFGNDPLTAIRVLSEIGADMSVFPTSKHLVSWAGCCPRNDKSAKRVKSTRITKAGTYLKPLLVQLALGLRNSKKHPEVSDLYKRVKSRRGTQKANIAVCNMLLTSVWHVLAENEPYTDEGYKNSKPVKKKVISQKEAMNILQRQGFVIAEASQQAV